MDAILARLSQLEDRARDQNATVARLSTENRAQKDELEAHTSAISDLATENGRLSSEVGELRSLVSEQETIIGVLETASYPEGRFVCIPAQTGSARDGIWCWTRARYLSSIVAARPRTDADFATLTDLPIEVIEMILELLPLRDKAMSCRISFKMLEAASNYIYPAGIALDLAQAQIFVIGRESHVGKVKSTRIGKSLLPDTVSLSLSKHEVDNFARWRWDNRDVKPSATAAWIKVSHLTLAVPMINSKLSLKPWTATLQAFDPAEFTLVTPLPLPNELLTDVIPTEIPMPRWRRLETVVHKGGGAVFVQCFPEADEQAERLLFAPGRTQSRAINRLNQPRPPPCELLVMWTQTDDGEWHKWTTEFEYEYISWLDDPTSFEDAVAIKFTLCYD